MAKAYLFVLDSFGIGGAPDAEEFGDEGSNTLGHIAEQCALGKADKDGVRSGPLKVPNMERLGLGFAAREACGQLPAGFDPDVKTNGRWANAVEVSRGKDTPSGHWEIAGVPVLFEWGYFPPEFPSFPEPLIAEFLKQAKLPGILGNKAASGIPIIKELGEEHIRSGMPICYTSADSVFQIAAHETHFGLERLQEICQIARKLVDPYNIGRVIARPFVGETPEDFERTGNRRDYSVPPPEPTLLDRAKADRRAVIAIGKISDIYAHQGITDVRKAHGNAALFDTTLKAISAAVDGDFIFTNFVDFDMLYGHPRDVIGYAAALEYFDNRLPEVTSQMRKGDLLILTADHGNDPTWRGTDHTREQVPVMVWSPGMKTGYCGQLPTFADIGETIAEHLGLHKGKYGKSFL